MKRKNLLGLLLFLAMDALLGSDLWATHFRYGTLTYTKIGPNEADFQLTGSFRRGYPGRQQVGDIITEVIGGTQLFFGDGQATPVLRFVITAVDVSQNWVLGVALEPGSTRRGIRHTYRSAGPFTAAISSCCRLSAPLHVNNPDGNYRLESIVDFRVTTPGNPPVSNGLPIVTVEQNRVVTFTVPAASSSGDRLRWRLATPGESGGLRQPGTFGFGGPYSVDPNDGTVTWNTINTIANRFYSTQIIIEALSTGGAVKFKTAIDFFLQVVPRSSNRPPQFIPPTPPNNTPFNISPNQNLTFVVKADSPDGPGVRVSLNAAGLPQGSTFPIPSPANPVQSTFSWTPTTAQVGVYLVTFSARDTRGLEAPPTSVRINVLQGNRPPQFTAPTPFVPVNGTSGVPLSFPVRAIDPDAADVVQLAAANVPAGASFPIPAPANPVQSTFIWPSPVAGNYSVTFSATDNHGAQVQHVVQINIQQANRPPQFVAPTPFSPVSGFVGSPVNFTVRATDPDAGDVVTLSVVSGLPAGASFPIPAPANPVQSTFTWNPPSAGTFNVTFRATDNHGAQVIQVVRIDIRQQNRPPVFVPPSPTQGQTFYIFVRHKLSFNLQAMDPDDGDVVTMGIANPPRGATLTPPSPRGNPVTAQFQWIPGPEFMGTTAITFTALDNHGAAATPLTVNVVVYDDYPPGCTFNLSINPSLQFRISSQDPGAGLGSIDVLDSNNASIEINPFSPGTTDAVDTIVYTDDDTKPAWARLTIADMAKNSTVCGGVFFGQSLINDPVSYEFNLSTPSSLLLYSNLGMQNLRMTLNGRPFRFVAHATRRDCADEGGTFTCYTAATGAATPVDVSGIIQSGRNVLVITSTTGDPDSYAGIGLSSEGTLSPDTKEEPPKSN